MGILVEVDSGQRWKLGGLIAKVKNFPDKSIVACEVSGSILEGWLASFLRAF
jgi:hypothetical protein